MALFFNSWRDFFLKSSLKSAGLHMGLLILLLGVLAGAFVEKAYAGNNHSREQILVFAAASLTESLTQIGKDFDKIHDTNTVFSFASSTVLARQIAQGAPAQLFVSADQKWANYLLEQPIKGPHGKVDLLFNELVLIAPKQSQITKVDLTDAQNLLDIIGDSRLAMGDPDRVPAGTYAKQAFESLGSWSELLPVIAPANSVRGALALVERGESPLGIVYETDAILSDKVKIVARFPENTHPPITYPLLITRGDPSANVMELYHYLQGDKAGDVFKNYGFKRTSMGTSIHAQ